MLSSGSIRQPPPGAAVACQSSSKPSSGAGRIEPLRRAEHAAAGTARARAPALRASASRGVDLDEVADHPEPAARAGST